MIYLAAFAVIGVVSQLAVVVFALSAIERELKRIATALERNP